MTLTALNVCYTDEIPPREIDALKECQALRPVVCRCILITKDVEKEDEGFFSIPLWKLAVSHTFANLTPRYESLRKEEISSVPV